MKVSWTERIFDDLERHADETAWSDRVPAGILGSRSSHFFLAAILPRTDYGEGK